MFERFRKKKQNNEEVSQEKLDIDEFTNIGEEEVEKLKQKAESMEDEDIQKHERYFSVEELWEKIKKVAKKAGASVVYVVLILYYTLQKPEIPFKVKATIAGALGYFILPIDIIPDIAPGAGYVDDLTVLTAALFQVAMYIDEDIKNQAKEKLRDLFGDDIDISEIDDKL